MTRNKGIKFWKGLIDRFEGKDLTDEDFAYCDLLDEELKTKKDKTVQLYFNIMIENQEQKEPYFRKDLLRIVRDIYYAINMSPDIH